MNTLLNDTADRLRLLCERHGASMLALPDGGLLVLDRFCRHSVHVGSFDHLRDEHVVAALANIKEFLSGCSEKPEADLYPDLNVHVLCDFPLPRQMRQLLEHIVSGCDGRINARVVLHLDVIGPRFESDIVSLTASRQLAGRCQLRGRLPPLAEETLDRIVAAGVTCYEVAGWWRGCKPVDWLRIDRDRIGVNASNGLCLPILWYVHEGNIDGMLDRLDQSLDANHFSGFALLPVSLSPHAASVSTVPRPPRAEDFCDLLSDVYQRFRFFDNVLEPLVELARNVRHGGWHRWFAVPRPLNMLIDDDLRCCFWHQLPSAALHWSNSSDILTMSPEDAIDSFLETSRGYADFSAHPFCGHCPVRYICGGLDPILPRSRHEDEAQCVCSYRRLFAEFFLVHKYLFEQEYPE